MLLIRNGHIRPITSPDIACGEILVDEGKIIAIGEHVDAPADVQIIDAQGMLVTPGFVDGHCHIGMHEEASRWEGNDTNEYSDPVTPQVRAIDSINPLDEAFGNALRGGVTTAVTGPGSANVIGGAFCAMKRMASLASSSAPPASGFMAIKPIFFSAARRMSASPCVSTML